MTSNRRVRGAALGVVFAVLAILAGLVVSTNSRCGQDCHAVTANVAPVATPAPVAVVPEPAKLWTTPKAGAVDINPDAKVVVAAVTGTLTDVELVDDWGRTIEGASTPDRRTWHAVEALDYGRTYTMTVASIGPGAMPSQRTSTFSTLAPRAQTQMYFNTTAGNLLADGGTYGIGTVVVAHFDEPITDKAAAEKRLKVSTEPPVAGVWNWADDQHAHWRPEKYYAPGTRVSVEADIFGLPAGNGIYGAQDEKVSFTIGAAHVSIADDKTKQISVFDNGKLVRTMPTSMGKGGTETVAGKTFSFWTPPGTYTVLDKANPVVMDSSTYGLPTDSGEGYKTTIPWATRISIDGIYLHQLNQTVWAQGNTNVSHGCLNLSGENAQWFYDFSVPGDVVEVRNTGGPPLQRWQNGDWSVPWDQWVAGSALH